MKSVICAPVGAISAALLVASPTLAAQQVVEVTGRDRQIEPDFEEVYRVGVIEGDTGEMFAEVKTVGFDAAGHLYVFDRSGDDNSGDARIVVFDRTGAFVRVFGSAGEGPGEFKDPYDIVILRDGSTAVEDNGHDAYQIFDPSGTFVRMVRMAETDSKLVVLTDVFADPAGGAVYKPDHGGTGDSDAPGSRPVTRLSLAGEVVETDTVALGWLPPRGDEAIEAEIEVLGGAFSLSDAFKGVVLPAEFEPALLMGVMPDGGLVYSDSSAYALKITSPGGPEVRRIITRPLRPEPVTESIKKEYRERRAGRRNRTDTSSATTDQGEIVPIGFSLELPEPVFFPEIPVLRALSATWEGRIWVQRRGEEPESDGPIDILTVEGDYLGTFRTDATQIPDAFGPDGLAAFIELDEFDVARVVVRRLPAEIR
ncbi:MAG: 6-bladed beta-propeller [Gemmatimonadota bacterium]|nr:6-bladed beta-propeller [Gemmatimonadota bacterium]